MTMKTKIKNIAAALLCLCAAAAASPAQAQETFVNSLKKQGGGNVPGAGSHSIGFMYNPVSGVRANGVFKAGDFVGNTIAAQGAAPYQMFILADPMISLRYKYKMKENVAFRATLGFSGARFNYKEYVRDDAALADDPFSTKQVEDIIRFKMSGGGINLGLEFSAGKNNLRFAGGVGLMYSFGGGSMKFSYGNKMDEDNKTPSVMPIIDSLAATGIYYDVDLAKARPTKRYEVGVVHAFGLTLDAGVEWHFTRDLSVGATLSFIPLIYAIQPKTYTDFEGFSAEDDDVKKFRKKVSSGSNYLLYGTENIGLQLSFNYYF